KNRVGVCAADVSSGAYGAVRQERQPFRRAGLDAGVFELDAGLSTCRPAFRARCAAAYAGASALGGAAGESGRWGCIRLALALRGAYGRMEADRFASEDASRIPAARRFPDGG